jgi:hypothetical protein
LCLALASLAPGAARAFHAGNVFDKPPGAGGGGGLFYAGTPRDKGWTCTACHVEPPGRIQVRLFAEPADLLQMFRYAPGQMYTFTVTLEGEWAGLGSPLSNYNGLVFSIVDPQGAPVGTIGGFAAEDFHAGWPTTIASAGQVVGSTSWTFQWTAGAAGSGPATIYVAVVDGNGADSDPTQTLTDPFGDDVFLGTVSLQEGAATAGAAAGAGARAASLIPASAPAVARRDATRPVRAPGLASFGALACAVTLAALGGLRRRKRR